MKRYPERGARRAAQIWMIGLWLIALSLSATAAELDRVVAVVNNGVILRSELDNQIREIQTRAAEKPDSRLPPRDVLEQQVLDRMILAEIQSQLAEKTGIKITDEAVNQAVASIARRNNMRLDDFIATLQAQGVDYKALREDIRRDLSIDQLRQREVGRRIVVTEREIDNQLASPGNPREPEAGMGNKEPDKPANKTVISETHARHILIRPSIVMDDAKIRATMARLRNELGGGADFAALAKQYSNDPTADQGGDLGWLARGATVPEFQQVMDALAPGQISEPFRSRYGWHLVQVLERRDRDATDEAERERARQRVFQRKLEEATQAWQRRLREEAYVEIRLDHPG